MSFFSRWFGSSENNSTNGATTGEPTESINMRKPSPFSRRRASMVPADVRETRYVNTVDSIAAILNDKLQKYNETQRSLQWAKGYLKESSKPIIVTNIYGGKKYASNPEHDRAQEIYNTALEKNEFAYREYMDAQREYDRITQRGGRRKTRANRKRKSNTRRGRRTA